MLLNGYDLGKCGIEQVLCAGKVSFDTKDVDKGVAMIELPENIIITKVVAVVNTAFNAGTANVLTVGTNGSADNLLGTNDVTKGAAGAYQKNLFKIIKGEKPKIKAKFTSAGTAATAGEAEIYLNVVRIPE